MYYHSGRRRRSPFLPQSDRWGVEFWIKQAYNTEIDKNYKSRSKNRVEKYILDLTYCFFLQPSPTYSLQCVFEIIDTLIGLVIFAVIVGDVGNMVTNMNATKADFDDVLDGCKQYMIYRFIIVILIIQVNFFGDLSSITFASRGRERIALN